MKDIVPELLEQIQKDLDKNIKKDSRINKLQKKIQAGKGDYTDVHDYATRRGKALSKALQSNLTEGNLPEGNIYFNIADRVVRPLLERTYRDILDISVEVQEKLNKKSGIGIKPVMPEIDHERIKGIVDKLTNGEVY